MTSTSPDGHPDSRKEKGLVQRAMRGDADAFGDLYISHIHAIYRYIYFRIGEEAEAEDLTEEVFTRAWEALPKYRPREYPFKSWLYRIAHNLVVDHHRKRKMTAIGELELQLDPGASHEEWLSDQQDIALLAQAIQQLSGEEQQVLILRFVEGLPHRAVAEAIGKTEGACRVIQYRALAVLQALLAKQMQPK